MNPAPLKDRPPAPAKPACPACRSADVSTTSKSITDATYWRCHGCGEIWNQSRLPSFKPGWRR